MANPVNFPGKIRFLVFLGFAVSTGILWGSVLTGFPAYETGGFQSKQEYLWTLKGIAFTAKEDFESAARLLEKADRADPKGLPSFYLGRAYREEARMKIVEWARSRKRLRKDLDPVRIKALYEKSARAFKAAAENFPNREDIRSELALVLLNDLEDFSGAEELLLKSSALKPADWNLRLNLIQIYRSKKLPEKIKELLPVMFSDPDPDIPARAQWIKGTLELDQRNFFAALQELKKAVRLDSSFKPQYYDLAKAYQGSEQVPPAVSAYKKFMTAVPQNLRELKCFLDAEYKREQLKKFMK